MANLMDYIGWRGDLSFDEAPFNDVDNLALCALAYVKFPGTVPAPGEGSITVERAAAELFSDPNISLPKADTKDFQQSNLLFFDVMAGCRRYSRLLLSDYVQVQDEERQEQFSAITISTGGDTAFVAFRGTDNTLVGWKEDFNMTFMEAVPSQKSALAYLGNVEKRFSSLRVGGHSKGGNLAVYAATYSSEEIQKKLLAVYNNDGPGFSSAMIALPKYTAIRDRVRTFVPQSSVVGMLMEHEESYMVVHSTQTGVLQHNPYSWEVMGPEFVLMDTVTNSSRFTSSTIKNWLAAMDRSQREEVIDAVFTVFEATNADTLKDLSSDWLGNSGTVLRGLKNMDPDTRKMIMKMIRLLFDAAKDNMEKSMELALPHIKHKNSDEEKA